MPRPAVRSAAALAPAVLSLALAAPGAWAGGGGLDQVARPPQVEAVPPRPRPLIEWGEDFHATGPLGEGWRLPTGATWRPQLLLFGTLRSAVQGFDDGGREVTEWVNRLDLFANLRLSGTERLLVGLRPLNDDTHYSGYRFKGEEGWHDGMNAELRTLFFEGELGEIFPRWDAADRRPLDLGFSVGRQPVSFQDGLLVDDIVDAVGVTKNSFRPSGTSNLRVTALFAWDEIHRGIEPSRPTRQARGTELYGLFASMDLPSTTLEVDAVHVRADGGDGAGLVVGVGATQRLGRLNTTFRVLASESSGPETAAMGNGRLAFVETSWTPAGRHDLVYVNGFVADGRFTSAARDPESGGPLGRVGILFDAAGLGQYGAALSPEASDAAGFGAGWQGIFADGRRQVVVELGGRTDLTGADDSSAAVGVRFEQALGRRFIVQVDAHVAARAHRKPTGGGRVEMRLKF